MQAHNQMTFPQALFASPRLPALHMGGSSASSQRTAVAAEANPPPPCSHRLLLSLRQPCAPLIVAAGVSRLWRQTSVVINLSDPGAVPGASTIRGQWSEASDSDVLIHRPLTTDP